MDKKKVVGGVIVECPTEEIWDKVVGQALSDGCEWARGGGTGLDSFAWQRYRERSCIAIDCRLPRLQNKNELTFSDRGTHERGYYSKFPIITAEEYFAIVNYYEMKNEEDFVIRNHYKMKNKKQSKS